MSRLIGFAVSIVLILAISGPHSTLEAQKIGSVPKDLHHFKVTKPDKPVPAVSFIEGKDRRRSLADYKGRGVVLNFWATWCAPCVREMPQLDRLNAMIRGDGVDVLTLSEDRPQNGNGVALIEKFYQINGLKNLAQLRDTQGKVMRRFAVRGLPTTILINAKGREVGRVVGPAEWDKPEVAAFLRRLLSPNKP